jgi:Holliday junction resolvase RusA-like endonuclease
MATHTLHVEGWQPAKLNELMRVHWSSRRQLKETDYSTVLVEACNQNVPKAEGRRRVSVRYTLGKFQRLPDVDDPFAKSLLDALVRALLLVDDSPKWCEYARVQYQRGPRKATTVTLEDLP